MTGLVIITHGSLSGSLIDTLKMFYDNEKQIVSMSVDYDTNIDLLKEDIKRNVAHVDDGDGVIILADIPCGSPCNACFEFMSANTDVISGVNLAMLLSAVTYRNTVSRKELIQKIVQEGMNSIVYLNEKVVQG